MIAVKSPCSACHEGCCRDYLVTVSGMDVHRICVGLGLTPDQFTVPTDHGEPPSGFRLDHTDRRFRLSLDKQAGGGAKGWCVFWLPFGSGLGRCGIYALRPGVCRTYPATLVDGEVALRQDIMCPEGSWGAGSGLFTEQWRSRAEWQYAELEIDAVVNQYWNESAQFTADPVAGFRRYLDWILTVYRRLADAAGSERAAAAAPASLLDDLARVLEHTAPEGR